MKTEAILEEVVNGIYEAYPALLEKYGELGRKKCREDNQHHFDHLKTSFQMENTQFFIDYAVWLIEILTVRGMKTEHLIDNFQRIHTALKREEPAEEPSFYLNCLEQAMTHLRGS